MSQDRQALFAALNDAVEQRTRADARLRRLSNDEVRAAEDPIALQDLERDIEALRHDISALDVDIAELEQKIADASGPNV